MRISGVRVEASRSVPEGREWYMRKIALIIATGLVACLIVNVIAPLEGSILSKIIEDYGNAGYVSTVWACMAIISLMIDDFLQRMLSS